MQYKCTIGSVLFSGTLLCTVTLSDKKEVECCLLTLFFSSAFSHKLQWNNVKYPFENLVIFVEYYLGKGFIYVYMYICIYTYIYIQTNLTLFIETSCFRYEGRYRSPSTKLHGVSSQLAADFTHTALETAWINMDKDQCITISDYNYKLPITAKYNLQSGSHMNSVNPTSVT